MFLLGLLFGVSLVIFGICVYILIYLNTAPKYKLEALKEKKKALEQDNEDLKSIENVLIDIENIKEARKSRLKSIRYIEEEIKNLER